MSLTPRLRFLALASAFAFTSVSRAAGLGHVRFVVTDPVTQRPIAGTVRVTDANGRVQTLPTRKFSIGETSALNVLAWSVGSDAGDSTRVTIPAGTTVTLVQRDQVPTKEIVIHVTASRIVPNKAPVSAASTSRDRTELQKFNNTAQADAKQMTKGQAGVAEDSGGQAHVRGEHGDISYVVDGVPLPDTLAGRQGTVVVGSTIQNLEIITGGFAPEFGGQVAAVLNVMTLPSQASVRNDANLQAGSFGSLNGDLTSTGSLGKRSSYVIDLNASRSRNYQEPPQPDRQEAHNEGQTQSAFLRFRSAPNSRDGFSFSLSGNPADIQIANRTGLGSKFRTGGQGYGLFGLRNADGSRPDITADNAGTLGSENISLRSQQDAGMDINERDVTNFGTLSYTRKVSDRDRAQLSLTLLHSGQDLTNNNPSIDPSALPVDNSIEYNPTARRNIHHLQLTGSYAARRGPHQYKFGFLADRQSGVEAYRIEAASQLALDAIAAIAPELAPAGSASSDLDVNGNPVYTATGPTPTRQVVRTGTYAAGYAQDTLRTGRLTTNYGVRLDHFYQHQNLGQSDVDKLEWCPRVNFQYELDRTTRLSLAYNHLLNTPPLAQGASLGAVIQPETLDQFDAALSKQIAARQHISVAYYYKQIKNQIDLGLLIPGSQIGLYSAVSLERAGVHGIEFSYDLGSFKGVGWDAYVNYSYSSAKPWGTSNTGEAVDAYNDHDQRQTLGLGAAYTWPSGVTMAVTYQLGSGLASSVIPPSVDRTPRDQVDLRLSSGERFLHGRGGLSVDVENVMDSRKVINFQSEFSGTRFQQGRRVMFSVFGRI